MSDGELGHPHDDALGVPDCRVAEITSERVGRMYVTDWLTPQMNIHHAVQQT